jgi:surface protein
MRRLLSFVFLFTLLAFELLSCRSQTSVVNEAATATHVQGRALGADCRRDAECADGFCDSALGYKCSKRCTSDSQCKDHDQIEGEFCRPDGRCASKVFVSVWEVANDARVLTLPYSGKGACDFDVIWDWREGEDIAEQWQRAEHISDCDDIESMTHVYAESGEYTVKIRGVYEGFGHNTKDDAYLCREEKPFKLRKVLMWGAVGLGTWAFAYTDVVFAAPDIPDASKLRNISGLFADSSFNQPLEKWDVSKVTDMSGMFGGARVFNQPLEKWDVSKVTNMSEMFAWNSEYDQPLENWNVSKVTDMSRMFLGAEAFNQPLENWDVSKVTNMSEMFAWNSEYDQPLENWDVSKVTDMSGMFTDNSAFNQPLEKWDVSNVIDMSWMFANNTAFNQPLENWDVGNVSDMSWMFANNTAFNQPLENWDVSKVSNMSWMFAENTAFNQPLENWVVGNVRDLRAMFVGNQGMSKANFCAFKLKPVLRKLKLGLEEKYSCP